MKSVISLKYFTSFNLSKIAVKHLTFKQFDLLNTIRLNRTKTIEKNPANEQVLMKDQHRTQITHHRNISFKNKMKRLQFPQKLVYKKFYIHEKIIRTQNCRRNFIKSLPLEKRKGNM